MKDRVVQFPNRYKLTPVSGDIYDITPEPGVVSEEGTLLSKVTLLSDQTVAALEAAFGISFSADPKIDEALAGIASKVARIIVTSYIGTGQYGSSSPSQLTFDFAVNVVVIYGTAGNNSKGAGLAILVRDGYSSGSSAGGSIRVSGTDVVAGAGYTVTFSGNNVSWYAPDANVQMNKSGSPYYVIAW